MLLSVARDAQRNTLKMVTDGLEAIVGACASLQRSPCPSGSKLDLEPLFRLEPPQKPLRRFEQAVPLGS